LLVPHLLVAALRHNFGDRAVGRAVFDRDLAGLGEDLAAISDDLLRKTLVVVDLDAEMVDCRALANELGLFVFFAVIDHQREIDIAVGQVPRNVSPRPSGLDPAKPEHVFVELRSRLEVGDFERHVVDARHPLPSYSPLPL
jgi:hypothetical protein